MTVPKTFNYLLSFIFKIMESSWTNNYLLQILASPADLLSPWILVSFVNVPHFLEITANIFQLFFFTLCSYIEFLLHHIILWALQEVRNNYHSTCHDGKVMFSQVCVCLQEGGEGKEDQDRGTLPPPKPGQGIPILPTSPSLLMKVSLNSIVKETSCQSIDFGR